MSSGGVGVSMSSNACGAHIYDMHCHLGFYDEPAKAAGELAAAGVRCMSATCTPHEYAQVCYELASSEHVQADLGVYPSDCERAGFGEHPCEHERVGFGAYPCEHVRVGLGVHPWECSSQMRAEELLAVFDSYVSGARFIGEVGLDFGKRFCGTEEYQLQVFEGVLRQCAAQGGKLLSIHAVKSAEIVLALLEKYHVLESNTCILHWFSGTSAELQQAIQLGCWFSVGSRMLATKRGREYAKAIPLHRLLLETDGPQHGECAVAAPALARELRETLQTLEALRGEGSAERICEQSEKLFLSV